MTEYNYGWRALAALGLIAAGFGWAAAWVVQSLSNQQQVRRAKARIAAHLLEFRLFGDEPRMVLRTQLNVARQSLHLMRLLLLPAVALGVPMLVIYPRLDAVFGQAPLIPGETTVATIVSSGGTLGHSLTGTGGVSVESPPVLAVRAGEISWRIRAGARPQPSQLRLASLGAEVWTESVSTGAGPHYGAAFSVSRIRIQYPAAMIWRLPWLVWFLIFSALGFFLH